MTAAHTGRAGHEGWQAVATSLRTGARWGCVTAVMFLMFVVLTNSCRAAATFSPTVDSESHVDIRMESWLESLPVCGFVPLTVRIRNGDSQTHTWSISSSNGYGAGGGLSASADLTVEGGHTGERVIYVPVTAQTSRSYYYGALNFSISGYGVKLGPAGSVNHSGGYGNSRTPFIGMSKMLAAKHWSGLKSKLASSSGSGSSPPRSELDGSEVDMASAPDDWRGYSGLVQLWMDESEWLAMRPAAKAAMFDWLAMGGQVYVMATDNSEARAKQLGLPRKTGETRRHGSGTIILMASYGLGNFLDRIAEEIVRVDTDGLSSHLQNYDDHYWELRTLAGELSLKGGLIFGFIAIFGILVGPVNLFWLAPAGKRQRMFWTTPLLSLGGSLLLVAIMVLQDGIGGNGARLTLAILQPEQKRLALVQEQVSRTGVLLKRTFPIAEQGWMQPLDVAKGASSNPLREGRYSFVETDTTRLGDWFASRSVQAHLLETVRPSRAGIEVFPPTVAGQPPSVLSNVESSLKVLFIVDESAVWKAEDVGTGEKKVATLSTKGQLALWLRDGPRKLAGPVISAALANLEKQTGCAFAEVADASKFAVPTLSSIRWNSDHAIIAGPFLQH
jgi:hypothetical protein